MVQMNSCCGTVLPYKASKLQFCTVRALTSDLESGRASDFREGIIPGDIGQAGKVKRLSKAAAAQLEVWGGVEGVKEERCVEK